MVCSQLVSLTAISPYLWFPFLIVNVLSHHLYSHVQIPLGDFRNISKSFMPCIDFFSSTAAEKMFHTALHTLLCAVNSLSHILAYLGESEELAIFWQYLCSLVSGILMH